MQGPWDCPHQQFPKQRYSRSLQQRELCIPNLVPAQGFRCPTLGASVAFYLLPWSGEEQVSWVG